MKYNMLQEAAKINKEHRRKSLWRRIVSMLAAIVVFTTTYALILPALTLETDNAEENGVYIKVADSFGEEAAPAPAEDTASTSPETAEQPAVPGEQAEQPEEAEAPAAAVTPEDAEENPEAAAEEAEAAEEAAEAVEMPVQSFEAETEDVKVVVDADEGTFPADTKMEVSAVRDSKVINAVKNVVEGDVSQLRAVDIRFKTADGEKIEPKKEIRVKMTSDVIKEIDDPVIVHVDEKGKGKVVDQLSEKKLKKLSKQPKDNEVIFDSKDVSLYVIVGTEILTDHVITANGESYTIEVTYGPEAKIPVGASLKATEIKNGTAEYQKYLEQTQKELEDDDPENEDDKVTFARFFDIKIMVDGKEVEPSAPVQVNIKYDDPIKLKSHEQIKAIHFASSGTEVISVDIQKNMDGIVEVTYMQDSFSVSGTVVQYLNTNWPANGDYVMIVRPYNSNNYYAVKSDGEITSVVFDADTGKVTFSDLTSTSQVDEYLLTVSNGDAGTRKVIGKNGSYIDPNDADGISTTSRSIRRNTGGNAYSQETTYNWIGIIPIPNTQNHFLTVNENSLTIGGRGANNAANRAVVMFANNFEVDEVDPTPSDDVDLGAPSVGKTLSSNHDGTYDLALSVTGKSKAQESHSTADVLVVFDTSGSMNSTRMTAAKNAMDGLASELFKNNTAANPDTVRVKLMTFSSVTRQEGTTGYGANTRFTYYPDFEWATGLNGYATFSDQLDELASSGTGGTNWEDALGDANDIEMRPDADQFVIFVSDGNPTFRNTQNIQGSNWNDQRNDFYHDYYNLWGTGSDSDTVNGTPAATTVARCYQLARVKAKDIVDAGKNFYTIGVFGSVDRMESLTAYAYSGDDSGSYPAGHYQTAQNYSDLQEVFNTIINDINRNFSYTNVEIHDGMTALTASALINGTVDNFRYTIIDKDNNDITATELPKIGTEAVYDPVTSTVEWPIGEGNSYKLLDGATYTVSFTVWPTQRAYDIIADLANGVVTYDDLSPTEQASIDRVTLTLKTNTDANVTYRQITTTNGVDGDPSDPKTVNITNPPGVPLAGTDMKIVKSWEDNLDPDQLLDLLTEYLNDAGTDTTYSVRLDVTEDRTLPVTTAEYPDGFIYKPVVSIVDGKVVAAVWPEIDIAIAPGIMVSEAHAIEHGLVPAVIPEGEQAPYPSIEMDTDDYSGLYYIIEPGHRYEVTEAETDYHFEMITEVDHPMIIDGVLKNIVFNEDETQVIKITPTEGDLTELLATNMLKGGINITKVVKDAAGNVITPKDDVFTVRCQILDKNGQPYTRETTAVGDDESDGVVYRVYASDAELATLYPGQVETGRGRTIKIGVLDSNSFDVKLKAGWTIRFINVPGGSSWTFEEINNPAGYEMVVAETTGLTGVTESNKANDCQITNKITAIETRILKIQTGTGIKDPETGEYTTQPVKLEGVKFIVKNNNDEDENNGKYLALDEGQITWVAEKSDATEFTTGSDGVVSLGYLPFGKYLLTETATQAGYNLLTEDVSIEVTADGVNYRVSSMAEPVTANKKTETVDGVTVVYSMIEVPNSAGIELPHTGGRGTHLYTLGGLALMGGALVYGFGLRRRRERRFNE